MKSSIRKIVATAAAAVLTMGLLGACGSRSDDKDNGGSGGDDKSLTIGYIPWDEDIVVTYLWKQILEGKGYDVEAKQLDVAPTFVGLKDGDVDLFLDTWLPVTHADYWEQYKDDIEDLGAWYDDAKLTIAVPDYMNIKSIDELNKVKDEVDGKIVGIESGAGLTRVTQDEAIPGYGLDDWTLQTSSTAAMLTALKKATDAKEPIVVTLWRPHWAYAAFPIRDLEDPKGLMGGAESIHSVARKGFSADHAEVAEAIKAFTMDSDKLADLEEVALQQHDDPEEGVKAWIADNQEWVDSLMK